MIPSRKPNNPDPSDSGGTEASTQVAQTDVEAQFNHEFNAGCVKQARREEVLADIIARIAAGEKAMIVFCEDHDVTEFAAFKLGAINGKLVVDEYD